MTTAPDIAAERKARYEAWMRVSSPNENHRLFEPMAGTFSAKSTAWFVPGQPPAVSDGTSINTLVIGGRYLRQEYRSVGPMGTFEGQGLFGHDNLKGRFTGLWVDNMSTTMMLHEGTYDPATKTFTMLGSFVDPVGQTWHTRQLIHVESRDQHTFKMFQRGPSGGEYQSLEVDYSRTP